MWPICHHLRLLKICVVDLCDLSIYQLVEKSYQSFQRPMREEETFFIPVEFLFVAVNNLCCFGFVFFKCVLFCFPVCKLLYFFFLLWMMKCVSQERSAPSILVLLMYAYLLGGRSRNKLVQAVALQKYRCDSCIWQYMMWSEQGTGGFFFTCTGGGETTLSVINFRELLAPANDGSTATNKGVRKVGLQGFTV